MTMNFSSETMETKKKVTHFSNAQGKGLSAHNSVSSTTILQNEGEIKRVSGKGKLRGCVASRPTIKEWLTEFLEIERK